jgi:hypothetical protein
LNQNDDIGLTDEEIETFAKLGEDFMNTLFNVIDSYETVRTTNEKLLESNYQHVGKIITCHLVIENLINTELNVLHNLDSKKIKNSRLTFSQKIELLPSEGMLYCLLVPGIKTLNSIRNAISHNLNFDIDGKKMEEIDIYLSTFRLAKPSELSIERRIEEFTGLCITLFSLRSPEIRKHWDDLAQKYPNLKEELKKVGDIGKSFKNKLSKK